MKKIYMLLFALSITTVITQATAKMTQHTIKNGETLFTIAHKHHTTIDEVRKANGLKKGDMLKLGRVLKVPQNTYFPDKKVTNSAKTVKQTQTKKQNIHHLFVKHSIKSGETLFTVAHKYHTTIDEVRKANGLKKGDMLKLGRVLKVPQNTYFPDKKATNSARIVKQSIKPKNKYTLVKHSIKSGETLFTIAHKHHTTIEEVCKANGLKKGDMLKLGRVLKVPQNTYFPDKKLVNTQKIVKKTQEKKVRYLFAEHKITNGETLFTIAHKHHTTIEEVRKANGLKKGETLKIGKILKVPTNTYNVSPIKVAKAVIKKKKIKVATKKISKKNKKLVASLSKLETVTLKKGRITHKKQAKSFSVSDIFFSSNASNAKKSTKITSLAKKKLGRRYVWGATGQKNTFDCSGFTTYVYKKNGINLPRRAIAQSKYGKYIPRDKLQKGDLIFFDTSKTRRGYVNHVGIYLGNGKFIHASSAKKKVVVSKLSNFYAQRYKGARRPS